MGRNLLLLILVANALNFGEVGSSNYEPVGRTKQCNLSEELRHDQCSQDEECRNPGICQHISCHYPHVAEFRSLFMTNTVAVIVVSIVGNLLTLIAVPYVRLKYWREYPWLGSTTTALILHLNLCNLLYCITGLPEFVLLFHDGFFRGSHKLCSWSAGFRNLFCYADILTMAAIALTRSIGLIRGRLRAGQGLHRQLSARRIVLPTTRIFLTIFFIWVLAFAIISPAVFQLDIGNYNFGQFGWDVDKGKCDLIFCNVDGHKNGSSIIYLLGVFVPLLIIIVSHASLGFFMTREVKKISYGLGLTQITPMLMKVSKLSSSRIAGRHESTSSTISSVRMNTLLVTLTICYVIFTVPLVVVELLGLHAFYSMLLYSWHWWMYAINFFIYVATSKDFRSVYQRFLCDMLHLSCDSMQGAKKILVFKKPVAFTHDTSIEDKEVDSPGHL